MEKNIEYYLGLPYTIQVVRNPAPDDPGWVARVVELPGCLTEADTFEELGEMIADAMRGWIEIALEDGIPVPEPRPVEEYSGKFVVRVPKSLHRELVNTAEADGVSLNAFISVVLGKAVGGAEISLPTESITAQPVHNWQRLSEKARRVLIANGMSEEAQIVDERLFAQWIEDHFAQVQAAVESGYYREALEYLQPVRQALDAICSESPLISGYCRMVAFLKEQMELNHQLRQGVIQQTLIRERVSAEVRSARGFRYQPSPHSYPAPGLRDRENITLPDTIIER